MGGDGQENDLRELLLVKGAKDAPTEDLWLLSLLFLNDDHSFVDAVHHETDDVGARHSWELLGDDVFQINQIAHILECPKLSGG